MLEGKLTAQAGQQRFELMPGDAAVVPMGVAHTFRVDSDEARVLVLSTPAGLERMVRDGAVPATGPHCLRPRPRDRRPRNSTISSAPTDKSTSALRSRLTTNRPRLGDSSPALEPTRTSGLFTTWRPGCADSSFTTRRRLWAGPVFRNDP